ncbi:MAG TPA: thioredoxin domain-containing protein [Ktedonobacteraceae bacterium]|nr:thioredoxin domain-containing protein [Ktedonobacteraceae bacterium]
MQWEKPQNVGGLLPPHPVHTHRKCFIGHPHDAWWSTDIAAVCHDVLPHFDLEPWYATEHFDPTKPQQKKVAEAIAHAQYGIYDLSYFREDGESEWHIPRNVFIELGIAIALNRPTLLLRHGSNQEAGLRLPKCLESLSEHIFEFNGQRSLQIYLEDRLPRWIQEIPERAWWNRYCIFGGRVCQFREAHPLAGQQGQQILPCYISDGLDKDRPDFRNVIEKVFERFNGVTFGYLDDASPTEGYKFLLCGYCQTIRTKPYAIYRITSKTPPETFIAIGISIGLETQFNYAIPKILLTSSEQYVPSLLSGYDVVITRNDHETKSRLHQLIPIVLQQVRQTVWKPRSLPFIEIRLQQGEPSIGLDSQEISTLPKKSELGITPVVSPATISEQDLPGEQQALLSPQALAESYDAVLRRRITDPATIRRILVQFETVAADPVLSEQVPFDAEFGARELRNYLLRLELQRTATQTSIDKSAEELSNSHFVNATDKDFEQQVLKSTQLVVVNFWAIWSGSAAPLPPTDMSGNIMESVIAKLSAEYAGKVRFARIDVDENPNIPSRYGIQGIPTTIFFKNGREIHRLVGNVRYEGLKRQIDKELISELPAEPSVSSTIRITEFQRYLHGIEFPATYADLLVIARTNNAPPNMIARLEELDRNIIFTNIRDVMLGYSWHRYLRGASYPATREQVLNYARANNAPSNLISWLEGQNKGLVFASLSEVVRNYSARQEEEDADEA